MKFRKIYFLYVALIVLVVITLKAYTPIRNFASTPRPWSGATTFRSKLPEYDSAKKTVFIVADPEFTVLFDLLAPFYLFNATENANVYVVAKQKTPILIKRDLFVCPQLTFMQADSMQLSADVIVIPALSIRDDHQDTTVITWIKRHYTPRTKLLTICDGASTGAATGLYDGKSITCHATDFARVKTHFSKPLWIQDLTVTKAGNAFSTAGVSNAVEGCLLVIKEMFGSATSKKVAADINYPHEEIRLAHRSIALSGGDELAAAGKVVFKSNKDIGILLDNGINEFTMATIIETYGRTFPTSFKTLILHDSAISTRYGLSIICTAGMDLKGLDELHLPMARSFSAEDARFFENTRMVRYDTALPEYLFDVCFKDVAGQYGGRFEKFIKISLDYN